jgi:hypothetical protein
MGIDRRRLFAASAAGAASETQSMPMRDSGPRSEIDAASLELRSNAAEDQTQAFQRAIERAAAAHTVLRLPPGFNSSPKPRSPASPERPASSCRVARR